MAGSEQQNLPPGFIIHNCHTGLAIPVHEDWEISEKDHALHKSCVISRQSYQKLGLFFTALEVNVYRDYQAKRLELPTQFALKELAGCLKRFDIAHYQIAGDKSFVSFRGLFGSAVKYGVSPFLGIVPINFPVLLEMQMMAENPRDIIYQLNFYSSPTTWNQDIPFRNTMLDRWKDTQTIQS